MSNGDDDSEAASGDLPEPADADDPAAAIEEHLDAASEALAAAETEADLDEVEAQLDDIEAAIEESLPEPDDEDEEDPAEELESRLSDLREDLEAERGPYASDVTEILEAAAETLRDSEWTEDGEEAALAAVETFLETESDHVEGAAGEDPESAAEAVEAVAGTVDEAGLDADEDAAAIETLLAAAETLRDELDAAEVWDDLTMREQLQAEGYYDVLESENRKDFPPEWSAMKLYSQDGAVEPILLALDKLGDSDFTEEYVFEQLLRLGRDAAPAFEEMHSRSQKRNKRPIEILGKIADDRACETLHDFIDGDGDPALQKVTLTALGRIGSESSTQPVADRLVAEEAGVRSTAARALGLIGDTRAIEPLGDVLADDEADEVRASAAWALRQIGTERALSVAAEYADDRSYIVQAEAEKAAGV
ncbi:MAG: HEAT repeat domain-containing protein [Haloarculaceae archaeon]